jgi:hypothetical protein
MARLGPIRDSEGGPPPADRNLAGPLVVFGRETVAAAFQLHDEQRLVGGMGDIAPPTPAEDEADLPSRRTRTVDAVDLEGRISGQKISHARDAQPIR